MDIFRATENNFGPLFCVITSTVEPRYNNGAGDWQNLFAISRFLFVYFYRYYGKESRSLFRGLRSIEVRYIEVPLYSFCNGEWRHMISVRLEIRTKPLTIHEAE